MRLLSVVHGPVFGGGNNQTMRLAGPLRERGWDTLAMVPDLPEALSTLERMRAGGLPTGMLELHRLRRSRDPRQHLAFARRFTREVGRFRGLIRRENIDLVQVFGDTNPHLAIAGHLEGKAVVWHLYDTVSPPAFRRLTMGVVTRLADVVMVTGRGLAAEFPGAEALGERCVTVYPPIDTSVFVPPGERRDAARAELGLPANTAVIGTVGNRNPTKGHDQLAEAVAVLRRGGRELRCCVLGAPSPAHAAHMAAVDARVQELGLSERMSFHDPGTRVAELMPALDVFVVASVPRSEGVPTAMLEAMSCGLPVVATDVGAIREVVEEGVTGHVVPPLEPERLARAIEPLIDEPARREAYGAAARDRAVQRYDVSRCVEVYEDAYRLALDHRARRQA